MLEDEKMEADRQTERTFRERKTASGTFPEAVCPQLIGTPLD
jgi:hypothetical protein